MSLTLVENRRKNTITKVLNILFGHLWVVELTYMQIDSFFKFTLRCKQSDTIPIICQSKAVNRGDKRTRHVRDRVFVKFERSRRYRDRGTI